MQGGEGGAQRAGLVVVGFCLIGVVLFAVIDRDRVNRLAPAEAAPTVSTVAGPQPCDGAAGVADAVRRSPTGGLAGASAQYDVKDVRVAPSDPTWGRFAVVARSGNAGSFQSAYGVVQCTGFGWLVNDVGTSAVGCAGAGAPPANVRSELSLACPS